MSLARGFPSKVAAVGLLLVAGALCYWVLISPVSGHLAQMSERIDEQRKLLGRLSAALESPSGESSLETAKLSSLNFVVLPGESEQIKAASLQARITEEANNVGVRPESLSLLAPRIEGGVRAVAIELQFRADLRRVQEMLLGLETQQPTVLVDSLQISRAADADMRPGRELDVRMTVLGIVGKAEENP